MTAGWSRPTANSVGIHLSNCEDMLERAGAWWLHSGIQEPSGGVARYHRSDLGKNTRVSTEITGYAVSALLHLHQRTHRPAYLDAAMRAARFLISRAWDSRLCTFPFEHSINGDGPQALAYFFDCGIIVRGLLAAWRVSKETEFLDAAIAGGRAMLLDFQVRGAIHPILELPGKRPVPYEPKWSASPGCYQLKSAMAWHELKEATGRPEFRDAYEAALEQALANEVAFLPGSVDRDKVMDRLHAFGYFLEGLLPAIDRPECARVYRTGLERMGRHLRAIAPEFARSDVYAQLLRARIYADVSGVERLDATAAGYEAEQAAAFQLASSDIRIHGGFGFGRKGEAILPFVNPVSTAFCVQALTLWSDHRSGTLETRAEDLI